jgi:hypothetical protein
LVKETTMRKYLTIVVAALALFASPAAADWTGKNATPATITFKNPADCTSVACVPVAQLYDGTNVVTLTTAGADAVSNTLTGLPTYDRMHFFNGTTWDRWRGAVTATLAAETTKVIGTVNQGTSPWVVSGTVTATGPLTDTQLRATAVPVSGPLTDTQLRATAVPVSGTVAVTGVATAANQATEIASLATIATNSGLPLPTQAITVPVGSVGLIDSNSKTALLDPCEYTQHVWTRIDVAAAASTVLVAGTSAKKTYICSIGLMSAGTTNLGIVEGSGTTCGTSPLGLIGGNTAAKGLNLTAQAGAAFGNGKAAIAASTVNANDICLINSAAIQVSGYIVTATP